MRKTLGLCAALAIAGCGGSPQEPCIGEGCMDVAGSYTVTATSNPAGNTCEDISYTIEDENGRFDASFAVQQDGADLTLTFESGRGPLQGTLYTDHTASFDLRLPHDSVFDPNTNTLLDYADDVTLSLTFTAGSDGSVLVSGTMHDTLSSNDPSQTTDVVCSLQASLTGQTAE